MQEYFYILVYDIAKLGFLICKFIWLIKRINHNKLGLGGDGIMKKWWQCPKCSSHKMAEENSNCIRCSDCGRFFDKEGNEINVNISLYNLTPIDRSCDLN